MKDTLIKPNPTKIKHRFWAQQQLRPGSLLELSDAESKHASKSLRLSITDAVEVWNGSEVVTATIEKIQSGKVYLRLINLVQNNIQLQPYIHLYAPLIKLERFEWMLEKATELGVNQITPVKYDFSQVNLTTALSKMDRWQKLIIEAGKQSRAAVLPILNTPSDFVINKPSKLELNIYGSMEVNSGVPQISPSSIINLYIGPEGGFSPIELNELKELATPLFVQGNILKAETAALGAIVAARMV